MNHSEIQEVLGAYALDAIDTEERAVIEEHLDTCEECRAVVGAHLETAGMLAAEPAQPPERVWEGIKDVIRDDDQSAPTPMVRPPTRRSPWVIRGAAALAAAAAVVFAFVAFNAVSEQNRLEDRVDELATTLETSGIEEAARAALLDPSATQIALRSADEEQVVRLVYLSSGTGYLVDNNLEPLESDRTYQLWALHGDRAVSAGVLGGEPGVTAFTVAGTVDGFAVSVEEATGATQPTTDPVVLGFLD